MDSSTKAGPDQPSFFSIADDLSEATPVVSTFFLFVLWILILIRLRTCLEFGFRSLLRASGIPSLCIIASGVLLTVSRLADLSWMVIDGRMVLLEDFYEFHRAYSGDAAAYSRSKYAQYNFAETAEYAYLYHVQKSRVSDARCAVRGCADSDRFSCGAWSRCL